MASSTAPAVVRPTSSTSTGPRPGSAGTGTPQCGRGRATGEVVLTFSGGRQALLAVPGGDDGHHRLGLVIALPGYGRTSKQLVSQSRLPDRARAAHVLVVVPEGAGSHRSWNFSGTTGYDDLAFLSALRTRLVVAECADADRVVITGISDGGDMAAMAACKLSGRFRAVVTVAASTTPSRGCRPIRIIAVHGDADPLDPYRGGPDGRPGYRAIPAARVAIAAWAALDGCRQAATRELGWNIEVSSYPCGAQLVTIRGGGHTWPGGAPVDPALGRTTMHYDATSVILGLVSAGRLGRLGAPG